MRVAAFRRLAITGTESYPIQESNWRVIRDNYQTLNPYKTLDPRHILNITHEKKRDENRTAVNENQRSIAKRADLRNLISKVQSPKR